MYLQKCAEYSGKVIGISEEYECCRSLSFMVISLKENIPHVIKAIPILKLNSDWLKSEILNLIQFLIKNSFNVRGVVCDNHGSNVSSFTRLLDTHGEKKGLFINVKSQKIYLFFDTAHLIKNIRNNLLNKKSLIFQNFLFQLSKMKSMFNQEKYCRKYFMIY